MIVTEKFKSTSLWTEAEHFAEINKECDGLTDDELELLSQILEDSEAETCLFGLELEREIVPIYDWIEDPFYMGDLCGSIYKPWKQDLIELFSSNLYSTAVIIGGIGSGKSTFSHIAILRMLYEASCLRDPARSYGLAPGSNIAFCNLAKSRETARRIVFEAIVAKIMEIPYFKFEFPPIKDNKDEIIFPKGLQILAGSSTDSSIIGANIFGGIIDEGNFWKQSQSKSPGSVKKEDSKFSKRWGTATKAGRLFDAVQRRMKSRYMRRGRLPGVLIVVSSKTTHDSFTETLVRNAQKAGDTTVFVRDRNIIEVKRDVFDERTFRVVVGNDSWQSKILTPGEDETPYAGATIIDIPEDLRSDFEGNIDEALRDIAGVSTMAISQFIRKPNMIDMMIDPARKHPFTCAIMGDAMQWDSRLPYRIHWNALARRLDNGEWVPKLNPEAKRHIHFDPALTGDAFGLCIGHIAGSTPVKRFDGSEHEITEELPYFVIDFVLSIQGEPGEEVLFRNVRQLCYEFSHHGFHIAEFTTDTYQSREMIQALREQGYKAGMYSVDTGIYSRDENDEQLGSQRQIEGSGDNKRKQAYRYLRRCIYEQRITCYDYPILWKELKALEDRPVMIDHQDGGSKDIADAVAGCIWTLFKADYYMEPLAPQLGISVSPVAEDDIEKDMMIGEAGVVRSSERRAEPPRKYLKKDKGPKSIGPSYKKISADGHVTDLAKVAGEDWLSRG